MDAKEELDAPCRWCGYNGSGYWQSGTHADGCPWHHIGGELQRVNILNVHTDNQDVKAVSHALTALHLFERKVRYTKSST